MGGLQTLTRISAVRVSTGDAPIRIRLSGRGRGSADRPLLPMFAAIHRPDVPMSGMRKDASMAVAKAVIVDQFEPGSRIARRGRLFTGRIEASVIRSIQRPLGSRCWRACRAASRWYWPSACRSAIGEGVQERPEGDAFVRRDQTFAGFRGQRDGACIFLEEDAHEAEVAANVLPQRLRARRGVEFIGLLSFGVRDQPASDPLTRA